MKISKSLLQAIMVGIAVGVTTTSCEKAEEEIRTLHNEACDENCILEHVLPEEHNTFDCPACGMG